MTPAHESDDDRVAAAAIVDDGLTDVDALLAGVAAEQRRAGRRVRGLVMTYPDGRATCASPMVLVDIDTRHSYLVSQPLGSGSAGCRVDPQGFALASRVLRDALGEAPELVVCNRYGALEVEGGGFAQEMLALMAEGIPLLTIVAARHLDAWAHYSGGAPVLPARPDAVAAWLERTLVPRVGPGVAAAS